MKGLLIKDGRILFKRSKRSLLFFCVFGFLISWSNDSAFFITWFMLMGSILSINTISYDEYDNCYPFLMTLPVSRKTYAAEKYVFGLLCCLVFLTLSAFFTFVSLKAKNIPMTGDDWLYILANLLLPLLILDVSIPVSLKYGSERKSTVLLILWGGIIAAVAILAKISPELLSYEIKEISFSPSAAVLSAVAAAAVLTAVSVFLSMRVMENKEF